MQKEHPVWKSVVLDADDGDLNEALHVLQLVVILNSVYAVLFLYC